MSAGENDDRYLYRPRGKAVEAIQWTGDNLEEVTDFLERRLGLDCDVRNEPCHVGGTSYNMLQFYAWGDDQEVDPTWWIVIMSELSQDTNGTVMHDTDFRDVYVKKEL